MSDTAILRHLQKIRSDIRLVMVYPILILKSASKRQQLILKIISFIFALPSKIQEIVPEKRLFRYMPKLHRVSLASRKRCCLIMKKQLQ